MRFVRAKYINKLLLANTHHIRCENLELGRYCERACNTTSPPSRNEVPRPRCSSSVCFFHHPKPPLKKWFPLSKPSSYAGLISYVVSLYRPSLRETEGDQVVAPRNRMLRFQPDLVQPTSSSAVASWTHSILESFSSHLHGSARILWDIMHVISRHTH